MKVDSESPQTVTCRRGPHGRHVLCGDDADLVADANRFLEALTARGLSPNTIRAYAFDLAHYARWLQTTDKETAQLEQADLVEFIQAERARKASGSSINRRLSTIDLFIRFVTGRSPPANEGVSLPAAYYKGRGHDRRLGVQTIGRPLWRALRVKTPKKLVQPLQVDQVHALLRTCQRYRDLALCYLMLLCGLRSCEVLAIEIEDIDSDHNQLRVQGKGKKERVIPLPSPLHTALAAYLRLERPRFCLTDRLFVVLQGQRRGAPMTAEGLRSLFRRRRRDPRLYNANPHRLRHTFGRDMAREGMSMPALMKLMGHADIETTIQYINLSHDDVAEAYQQAMANIRRRYEQ